MVRTNLFSFSSSASRSFHSVSNVCSTFSGQCLFIDPASQTPDPCFEVGCRNSRVFRNFEENPSETCPRPHCSHRVLPRASSKAGSLVASRGGESQRDSGHGIQAEGRLSALRQEATIEGPPPTLPADYVLELTRLRSQRERDDLRAQVAAHTVVTEDHPRMTNRSISTPSPDLDPRKTNWILECPM